MRYRTLASIRYGVTEIRVSWAGATSMTVGEIEGLNPPGTTIAQFARW